MLEILQEINQRLEKLLSAIDETTNSVKENNDNQEKLRQELINSGHIPGKKKYPSINSNS